MSASLHHTLAVAIHKALTPLVRLLLRHGVAHGELSEWAKRVFVEVAEADFRLAGRPQTVSRLAVLTGLSRKEVARIRALPPLGEDEVASEYNRATRVVSAWVREAFFRDPSGEPAVLPLEGPGASFAELVRRFSGDVPARAVLDELERVGMVALSPEGTVRLLERSYVPREGEVQKIEILGADVAELASVIEHNIRARPGEAFFQRKVAYDHVPPEEAARLLRKAARRAQALLERLDRLFARHDRDANPAAPPCTHRRRIVTGVYVYEEDWDAMRAKAAPRVTAPEDEDPEEGPALTPDRPGEGDAP
ncbi:MAG: DUF6502 family protein [Deferrisomatales bacterium]|nr:DUF6502 family protein [Deferrisomatales bacterium]